MRRAARVALWSVVSLIVILVVAYAVAQGVTYGIRRQKRTALDTLFQKTATALNDLKAPYTTAFGTLLGAVREGDLIPHDDDVDFALYVTDDEYDAWADKIMQMMRGHGWEVTKKPRSGDIKIVQKFGKWGFCCDIYRFRQDPLTGNWTHDLTPGFSLPANVVRDRELLVVRGIAVPVPPNAHTVLRTLYGDDYMVPQRHKKTALDVHANRKTLAVRNWLHKYLRLYV